MPYRNWAWLFKDMAIRSFYAHSLTLLLAHIVFAVCTQPHSHSQESSLTNHSAQAILIQANVKMSHDTACSLLTQCFHLLSFVLYSVLSSLSQTKAQDIYFLCPHKTKPINFSIYSVRRARLTSDPELTISSEIRRSLHSIVNLFCQRLCDLYTHI